jgi:AcrR family transcriptional regulator
MEPAEATDPVDPADDAAVDDDLLEDEDMRAADGRVPGRRGRATRQKLLDCTRGMLANQTYRELRVVDIARQAGTSPATFYQYFPDVNTAIVALAEEMAEQGNEVLIALVKRGPWRGAAGFETARAIARGYVQLWDDNWPLMRVLDLTAAEGDQRFRSIRTRLLNQFTTALSDVIAVEQANGRSVPSLDPMATAGVLVSMLAHVAAHRYGFEFYGIRTADLEESMAHILYTTATGQKPPKART